MKKLIALVFTFLLGSAMFFGVAAQEQNQEKNKVQLQEKNQIQNKIIHGSHFVDENGDGFNDNAPDIDGDGIPNGQDPDYVGAQRGKRNQRFVDTDGDGIADNARGAYKMKGNKKGGYGPGDGTGTGVGPKDGTGYGAGSGSGTGDCDGTGPKGKTNRGGRK